MDNNERYPKDHRLFHYTKQFGHLKDMLQNGIWPRYCEEDFGWLFGSPATIAFPMVCFCDIPLDAASNHRSTYGEYTIGFNKAWASEFDINPVWYVQEDSTVAKCIASAFQTEPRFRLQDNLENPFCSSLAFIKPTIAVQGSRILSRHGGESVIVAEEEMEWRHTPCELLMNSWKYRSTPGFISNDDHELSKAQRLKIEEEQIGVVIVPSIDDVNELSAAFPFLVGKLSTWEKFQSG